ncbi:nurim [Thamnophis elegans]|uniref:nurim-like n=1 Tax=Thamnophis elegans TaxID=35005 RepID=UPI001378BE31|nr:nurim-like [Thamnophis elegans]XP_032067696.1 nurim-like [Thamnophis elegans]XP_032067783.1 nurim [Thamnophis elegans]XP_032067784.1 nurim [Thamnophis elegans]
MAALQFLLMIPALGNFLFTFGTGVELIRFISFRAVFLQLPAGAASPPAPHGTGVNPDDISNPRWKTALSDPKILHSLTVDVGLIILFILQHSLMASDRVKNWTCNCFGVLQRTVYVFCTDVSLQLLMRYWQPVQDGPMLWNTNIEPWITWVPLICFILHFVSWLIIFSIVLIFDYAELMGVKQVYYYCLGMGDPLAVKSSRALRLYSHLRHPLYVEFLLILWAVPCLSLDRLLLASLFTVYLTCAHSLDEQDYLYLRAQLDKKFQIFSREEAAYGGLLAQNGPSDYKDN